MNHVYVVHPRDRKPVKLCPRDEVAHPNKLADIVFRENRNWRDMNIDGNTMLYLRGEYDKMFYDNVVSSHFYVLTDIPSISIFLDAQRVSGNSMDDMVKFLQKHHSTLFLITSPVFVMKTPFNSPNIHYTIPVNHEHAPIYLPLGTIIELRDIIINRCYTVCNGVTLFLAMVRANHWTPSIAQNAFENWQKINLENNNSLIMPVMTEVWQDLHTTHPIPMIADFPNYYATMYPPVPVSLLKLLEVEDTVPLSQFVDQNMEDEDDMISMYASPMTSMYPYFNKSIFDYYNPDFANIENLENLEQKDTIFEAPFDIEEEDVQFVDVEGFLISMLRSKQAWKWWNKYKSIYIKKVFQTNNSSYGFLMYTFQILFDLYEMPYPNIRYSKRKVRSIWNSIIETIEIPAPNIKMFMNIIIVKSLIYKHFNINRWNPKIPISFIIDMMKYYQDEIDLYKVCHNKVYTVNSYDPNEVLSIFAPHMRINNEKHNEYNLVCSFYQLLKMDRQGALFIKYILDRKVAKKILCIETIFGMKNNKDPYINLTEHNAYTIGGILMDYIKENRNVLL